jgi:ElaB/YqjD/DUF883 family membrane-anchored ribosome-binding protein
MNRTNVDEHQQQQHQPPTPQFRATGARAADDDRDAEQRRRVRVARLREAGRNLGAQIDEQVHKRPYMVVGAATGIGLLAGSIFGSRVGQVLLAAGVGYAAKNIIGGNISIERIQAGIEKLAREEKH